MTVTIGPAWPGRIIAAWMLSVFVTPWRRTVDDDLADLRSRQQLARAEDQLQRGESEQQLSWETVIRYLEAGIRAMIIAPKPDLGDGGRSDLARDMRDLAELEQRPPI